MKIDKNILYNFIDKKLITLDSEILCNLQFLCLTGSRLYGINTENSDYDLYACTIPSDVHIYPYSNGYLFGFDKQPQVFSVLHSAEIYFDENKYDLTLYSIVKLFSLIEKGSPNIIELFFIPNDYVYYESEKFSILKNDINKFISKHVLLSFLSNSKAFFKKYEETNNKKYIVNSYRLLRECEQLCFRRGIIFEDIKYSLELFESIYSINYKISLIHYLYNELYNKIKKSNFIENISTEFIKKYLITNFLKSEKY